MQIDPIGKLELFKGDITEKVQSKDSDTSFSQLITDKIGETQQLQAEADLATQKMATGELEDVHTAMIATQKAGISLQYTMAIRNKLIEAYQEIMRMQV